jgi:hypothetical protein
VNTTAPPLRARLIGRRADDRFEAEIRAALRQADGPPRARDGLPRRLPDSDAAAGR